jgi:hypothetical protein
MAVRNRDRDPASDRAWDLAAGLGYERDHGSDETLESVAVHRCTEVKSWWISLHAGLPPLRTMPRASAAGRAGGPLFRLFVGLRSAR